MEQYTNETNFLPEDVKKADAVTQYAFVLRAYSDSLVTEKEADEAAIVAKKKRQFLQEQVEKFMVTFAKSMDEPVKVVIATESKHTGSFESGNDVVIDKIASTVETKSTQELTKQVKGKRPDNESWLISAVRAIDELDRPATTEDICIYFDVNESTVRKAVRSATKYLRDHHKGIYGLACYSAPAVAGKGYRKVYINLIRRFFENNDPDTSILQPKYQAVIDAEIAAKGWITLDELQRRGGTVINEE